MVVRAALVPVLSSVVRNDAPIEGARRAKPAGASGRADRIVPEHTSSVEPGSVGCSGISGVLKTGHIPVERLPVDPHPTPVPAPERRYVPPRRKPPIEQTGIWLPRRRILESASFIDSGAL